MYIMMVASPPPSFTLFLSLSLAQCACFRPKGPLYQKSVAVRQNLLW